MNFDSNLQDEICRQLLQLGAENTAAVFGRLAEQNLSKREMYLEVIAGAARRMGELWDDDRASFFYIQCAMRRIERMIHESMPLEPTSVSDFRRNAIFITLPNESHTIGVSIAASIHRSRGWNIKVLRHLELEHLVGAIEASESSILGISIGSSKSMHALYSLVGLLKSHRSDIRILVSGSLVAMTSKPFQQLGVDAFTSDFSDAEKILEGFAASSLSF